jgi:uncharacterized protein (TIGR02246 family)
MAATADEIAIRKIIQDEIAAWNRGDAAAYSRQFAADGTFTNIRGQFFVAHEAFLKQHEVIFQGIFRNTISHQVGARRGADWKIVAYHNVDVKPGVPVGGYDGEDHRNRRRLLQEQG